MKVFTKRLLHALVGLLFLMGCSGDDDDDDDDGAGVERSVELTDAHNFSYTSELQIDSVPLAEIADTEICWDELTQDISGRPIDAYEEITSVVLLNFPVLTPDEVRTGFVADTIIQMDIGIYLECEPTDVCCLLSEFGIMGSQPNVQDYFVEGSGTWLIILSSDDGLGGIAFVFIEPDAQSTATEVSVVDGTSSLILDVDLQSLTTVPAPADGDLELDWEGLTVDGLGNGLDLYKLDRLQVGRYALDVTEIEARFYDIDNIAEQMWTLDTTGIRTAHMSDLLDDDGQPFTTFDESDVWLAALVCTTCNNPMPRFVTLFSVVP